MITEPRRHGPVPVWQKNPILVMFHEYLQISERLSESNARNYINALLNVSNTTGLSLGDLASCDADLVVLRGYPDRKWSLLKKFRGAVRHWQTFRGMSA